MSSRSSNYDAGYDPKLGYNRNAFEHRPIHLKAVGAVVKGIGTGIGMVSEAIHHQVDKKRERAKSSAESPEKSTGGAETETGERDPHERSRGDEKKRQSATIQGHDTPAHAEHHDDDDDEHDDIAPLETDEADWALDEAVSSLPSPPPTTSSATTSLPEVSKTQLPHPIVIPQRRPGTKTRGFIHAYAPTLSTHVAPPLSAADFSSFLTDLHAAAQASPIFDVILLASGLAGLFPGVIAMAVSTAVQVAATAGKEVQERWRVNRFLEDANRETFAPRGLFAMVVAYRPDLEGELAVGQGVVDMSAEAVAKYGGASGIGGIGDGEEQGGGGGGGGGGGSSDGGKGRVEEVKAKMKRLRVASAQSRGEAEMPGECAQLVFPSVDRAAEEAVAEAKEGGRDVSVQGVVDTVVGKTKGAGRWVNEYLDRRAAMEFAYKHPNSTLASLAPAQQPFKSKFSDPNAAVNKHLITMITGGRIKAEPLGARRRWERAQRREQRRNARGILVEPARRILQEDVLYLMIVNMPSEEELAEARKKLADVKKGKDK